MLEAAQRRFVDARPPLQSGELRAPHGQSFGLAGQLLGIDRVGVDLGLRLGFGDSGRIDPGLGGLDLGLEPQTGVRLASLGSERGQLGGLLGGFRSRGVTAGGERVGRLPSDQALEPGVELVDGRDVGLLTGKLVLGRCEVREAETLELGRAVLLGLAELGLHLGPPPKPSLDLVLGQLPLAPKVLGGLALTERDELDDQPEGGHADADQAQDRQPGEELTGDAQGDARQDEDQPRDGDPAPRRSGRGHLVIHLDLAGQHSLELADPGVEAAQPPDRLADDRQGIR